MCNELNDTNQVIETVDDFRSADKVWGQSAGSARSDDSGCDTETVFNCEKEGVKVNDAEQQ